MKKLIIAFVAFLAVLGMSVFEIAYTTDTFASLETLSERAGSIGMQCVEYKKQNELSLMTSQTEDKEALAALDIAARNALDAIDELLTLWNERKTFTLSLGNHTVVKSVEERLYTLRQQHSTEQWEDLTVTARALTSYLNGLKDDTHPTLPNLF